MAIKINYGNKVIALPAAVGEALADETSFDLKVLCLNTTQHNTTQHNTTQHNTTQHNTTHRRNSFYNNIFIWNKASKEFFSREISCWSFFV